MFNQHAKVVGKWAGLAVGAPPNNHQSLNLLLTGLCGGRNHKMGFTHQEIPGFWMWCEPRAPGDSEGFISHPDA